MINSDDLRAAVGSGLLNEAQAASLKALADSRRGARQDLSEGEEPFELFKGFNEIFIVVGLAILTSGWVGINGFALVITSGNVADQIILSVVIATAVLWVLSEYFIRKRRMVAPAIALSLLFAANAGAGFNAWLAQPFMIAQQDYTSLLMPIALSTGAIFIYWLRLKVPFAMALIAFGIFGFAFLVGGLQADSVPSDFSDLFLLSAAGPFAFITLAVGAVVFAVAMWFDMSDPHRVTRRSAQGFWLHVIAAPALVNTIALSLLQNDTTVANLMLLGILLLFAIVAILIDRRSFLIAAIGYIVTLAATVFEGDGVAMIIFLLGIFLVVLGAFWTRIRAALLSLVSCAIPVHRLPPSH